MAEHAVTEAMLEVADKDHEAEKITEGQLPEDERTARRTAWRDRISSAVARSLGCETYYWGANLAAIGRESAVQAWSYTSTYLFGEVNRLADEAWLEDGADLAAVGQRPRSWKASFRLGAASTIANRLYQATKERKAAQATTAHAAALQLAQGEPTENAAALVKAKETQALAIIDRGAAEVTAAYKKKTAGWRNARSIGSVSNYSGYEAGREAGKSVSLGGSAGALGSGRAALKPGKS